MKLVMLTCTDKVRVFIVSSPEQKEYWVPELVRVHDGEIQDFVDVNFPQNGILEVITDFHGAETMVPLAILVETDIPDLTDVCLKPDFVQSLLKTVLKNISPKISSLEDSAKNDPGFRASYFWDLSIKRFAMHIIAPNTFFSPPILNSIFREFRFLSPAYLTTAYVGFMMQDPIIKAYPNCVPIHLGANFLTIHSNSCDNKLVVARERFVPALIPASKVKGYSSRSFGDSPMWMAPKVTAIEYLIKQIKSKTQNYNSLISNVALTECGTIMSTKAILKMTGDSKLVENPQRRSIRFLFWLFRRVCPEQFQEFIFEQAAISAHYFTNRACTDAIFHNLFLLNVEGEFLSLASKGNGNDLPTVYFFNNVWKIDKGLTLLTERISIILTTFFGDTFEKYMSDQNQQDLYKPFLAEVTRLNYISNMRSQTAKAVAKMLVEKIQFDQDPYTIGCENVVICLKNSEASVRPGRPEDLVFLSTNVYYDEYEESECQDLNILFHKLFVDEDMREWIWNLSASFLEGRNPDRSAYFPFGCARNGKSGWLNLLQFTLGDYFGRFSSKALNGGKDASSATPEFAEFSGKRIIATSELNVGAEIEAFLIKAMTGDDDTVQRGLYKDPMVLVMMAKILIATNHMPIFRGADKALRDRIILILMESIFDNEGVPATEAEQFRQRHFPADTNFKETARALAPKFLFMLVQRYSTFKVQGLKPRPEKVVALCNSYWHELGVQNRFIDDCIEIIKPSIENVEIKTGLPDVQLTGDEKLTSTDAFVKFSSWAMSRQMDISKYPRVVFKSLMDSELSSIRGAKIKIVPDGWTGIRLK